MKNYIQEGRMITVAAPAGSVTSGDGVIVGSLFGIATEAAGDGVTTVRVRLDGMATAAA